MSKDYDFSQISEYLFIGKTPGKSNYAAFKDKGIELVINARVQHFWFPRNSDPPTVWVPLLDPPIVPFNKNSIEKAVAKADSVISKGGKVLVYCSQGRHRSVLVGCRILMKQGLTHSQAAALVTKMRPKADPGIWYVSKYLKQSELS